MIAPRIALLVAALVLAASVDLFAQQAAPVTRGRRVRVSTASLTHIGTVLESKSDTLVLDVEGGTAPLAIAVASITRLDVSRGRESHAFTGGCVGFLAGVATGAAMGFASGDEPAPCFMACSAEEKALVGAVVLGLAGAAAGFAVGAFIHSERWEPTYPWGRVRVGLTPHGDDGLAVSVSVAF
jgi:hypothetical protein